MSYKKTIVEGDTGKQQTFLPSRHLKQIVSLQSSFFGVNIFYLVYEYVSFNFSERVVNQIKRDFPTRLPEKYKTFCQTYDISTLKLS